MKHRIASALALMAAASTAAAAQDPPSHALAIAREVERIARTHAFWPGYEPLGVPLAVYDGRNTFLFRHPAPPEGFRAAAGTDPPAWVRSGRHPSVTANSSADVGGVTTATVLADGARAERTASDLAAVALHEAFHVFQRARHPGWSANEGDLLLYPVEDAQLLGRRRLEAAALARALAAGEPAEAACWAARALAYRRDRYARMDSTFSRYERLTELNEGLAQYVQLLALDRTTVDIPPEEFGAAEVRRRVYTVGPALAFLLDRVAPGWKDSLEANDTLPLDALLANAIASRRSPAACTLDSSTVTEIDRAARVDAAAVIATRVERRRMFDSRTGWRVTIIAGVGHPLWPKGFDPLNVTIVEGGLLHTRFLALGNDAGDIRVIDEAGADIETLTEAAGEHPLFNGVRRVVITGLAEPAVSEDGGRITLRTPGLDAAFTGATLTRGRREMVISLP
jgi:hypothetical protein